LEYIVNVILVKTGTVTVQANSPEGAARVAEQEPLCNWEDVDGEVEATEVYSADGDLLLDSE